MPGSEAVPIQLLSETIEAIQKLEKGHSTRQQMAKRAKIIRLSALGKHDKAIAREVGSTAILCACGVNAG
jgi:hypothetical protein